MMPEYERGGDLFQIIAELTSKKEPNKLYKLMRERDTGRVLFGVKDKGSRSITLLWSEDMERTTRVDQHRKKPMGGPIG
jgi:inorganic triphosphatase YgiF